MWWFGKQRPNTKEWWWFGKQRPKDELFTESPPLLRDIFVISSKHSFKVIFCLYIYIQYQVPHKRLICPLTIPFKCLLLFSLLLKMKMKTVQTGIIRKNTCQSLRNVMWDIHVMSCDTFMWCHVTHSRATCHVTWRQYKQWFSPLWFVVLCNFTVMSILILYHH